MFCPNCSEPKHQPGTQFCTKCGLDFGDLGQYVGARTQGPPLRATGIQGGIRLFIYGALMIPIWIYAPAIFPPNDLLVESSPSTTRLELLSWIAMWMFFIAGAGRIGYSLVFEERQLAPDEALPRDLVTQERAALPDGASFTPADAGRWKTTGELVHVETTSGKLR